MNKSFTLIEIIIYIAIVVVVAIAITNFALNIIFGRIESQAMQEVQQNTRWAIERISRAIKGASDVDLAESIFDTNPGKLTLKYLQADLNPTVFDVTTERLRVKEGDAAPVFLTSDRVKVANLIFKNFSTPTEPKNIFITLTIEHKNPEGRRELAKSITLETTVTLRQK